MSAKSETDPHYEDDATEIASVMQAFRQINENIETLNENQNDSTRTLSNLVRVEYADELARLGKSVEGLVQEQAALAKTVDKKQTAVRDLYDASRSLKGQDTRLSSVTGDLEELRACSWFFSVSGPCPTGRKPRWRGRSWVTATGVRRGG